MSKFLKIILIIVCIIIVCGVVYLDSNHTDNDSGDSITILGNGSDIMIINNSKLIDNFDDDDVGTCLIMENGTLTEIKCYDSTGRGSASE